MLDHQLSLLFYYPNQNPQYQWDTLVHCGDTINFDFMQLMIMIYIQMVHNKIYYLKLVVSFMIMKIINCVIIHLVPLFTQIGTNSPPPFITSGGTGGHFEWITDCSQLNNGCFSQGLVFSHLL